MNSPSTEVPDDRITPIEAVVIAYAVWTVAFLVGLWLGIGWAFALPAAVAAGVVILAQLRRHPTTAGDADESDGKAGSAAAWIVAAVLVLGWMVEPLGNAGRALLAAVAAIGVVASSRSATGSPSSSEGAHLASRLPIAVVAAAVVAIAHSVSWTAFTIVVSIAALGAAAVELRSSERDGAAGTASWRSGPPVTLVGLSLLVWTAFTRQFNPDDSYYANKAAHYAGDAGNFEVVNHLFGTPEEPHVPLADVLSAFEPLAGMLAGVSGIHHATILYLVLAPFAAFLIPAANRYAARAFGARRPDLVALVATAAILHLEAFGDFILLIDKIFQGKGALVLVALPILTGAGVRYWEAPSGRRLLVATTAMIAALGLTPTAGAPAVGAGLALLVAGLFVTRANPAFGRATRVRGVLPVATAFAFTLFAFWYQSNARQTDPTNTRFTGPENAWARRLVSVQTDAVVEWGTGGLLVIFSLVLVMLLGRTAMQRTFFTLVALGLFLLLFNPLLFTPLFDDVLHLNFLAWRFGWILPASLVIGLAFDSLDRPLPVIGPNLGVGILVVVLASALPLAARTDQEASAPWDLQNRWIRGAELVIDATPEGGRYLAPERIEIATTILSADIFPTYARQRLLGSYGRSGTSDTFNVELRNELARQVEGGEPRIDSMGALDTLGIDTVCTDPRIDAGDYPLLDAIPEKFEPGDKVRLCQIWTRVVPADR